MIVWLWVVGKWMSGLGLRAVFFQAITPAHLVIVVNWEGNGADKWIREDSLKFSAVRPSAAIIHPSKYLLPLLPISLQSSRGIKRWSCQPLCLWFKCVLQRLACWRPGISWGNGKVVESLWYGAYRGCWWYFRLWTKDSDLSWILALIVTENTTEASQGRK